MRCYGVLGRSLLIIFGVLVHHCWCLGLNLNVGPSFPVVGKPCPFFELHKILYFDKKRADLTDFKGKWLVLDFWGINCGACIASFPRVDKDQRVFKDKVQYMMIAYEDNDQKNEIFYKKIRAREKLSMPCGFDSILCKSWIKLYVPLIVVIDADGIVRAVTSYLSENQMEDLIKNKGSEDFVPYMPNRGSLKKTQTEASRDSYNGIGNEVLKESSISTFNSFREKRSVPLLIPDSINTLTRINIMGVPLEQLYKYAYFGYLGLDDSDSLYGRNYKKALLKIKDTSLFDSSYGQNINLFSYKLVVSPTSVHTFSAIKEIMRNDLQGYFGYTGEFDSLDEVCYVIRADGRSMEGLRSKGGQSSIDGNLYTGFNATNIPISDLVERLRGVMDGDVLIDSTGIDYNIDIRLTGIIDKSSMTKELRSVGLRVVGEKRRMKVLVIKDKVSN